MILLVVLAIAVLHYILGVVIFSLVDMPSDISGVKVWKTFVIGGIVMVFHRTINVIIVKGQMANFNWTLKEWIIK